VRETQSCVTVPAQVPWVYLGLLILGASFWRHDTSVVVSIYAHYVATLSVPETVTAPYRG
jgi:hypothetical protein